MILYDTVTWLGNCPSHVMEYFVDYWDGWQNYSCNAVLARYTYIKNNIIDSEIASPNTRSTGDLVLAQWSHIVQLLLGHMFMVNSTISTIGTTGGKPPKQANISSQLCLWMCSDMVQELEVLEFSQCCRMSTTGEGRNHSSFSHRVQRTVRID